MKKNIKTYSLIIALLASAFGFAQDLDTQKIKSERKAKDLVYDANTLLENKDYVSAEMEYRKAISEQKNNVAGAYNLAHSYYTKGNYDESLFRNQEAANNATSKEEKHRAFHNIGNILMKNEKCKEAVDAFKNALRNNPNDEETRYNFALAKDCAEQQDQDGGGDDNKEDEDKKDQKDKDKEQDKKDQEKKEDQKDKDNKDEKGEDDKKKGDDEKDEDGKPKDDKKDDGKGDKEKPQQQPKPQPGKMSPQQIKNILEAMNNQEQKVQEKINAEKTKGAKVRTEKDW